MGQNAMGATSPGSGGAAPKDTYMRNPPGGHPAMGAQRMGLSPGMGGGPMPGGPGMGSGMPGAGGGGPMPGGPGTGGGLDPRIAQMLAGVHFGGGPAMGNVQQMGADPMSGAPQSGGPVPGQGMPGFMNPNPALRSMQGPAVSVPGMYAGMPGAQQGIANLMQHFGVQQPGATQ